MKAPSLYVQTIATSDLELWAPEVNHISWIWFGLVDLWYHISQTLLAMDMRLVPLDTAKIEV